jgi:hypothetical protein
LPSRATDDIDSLYSLPLGEFVGARNELAKRLRKEKRGEEAAEVASLKKPTVPAWTVNQLARRERGDIDRLLDAGHRLREAHREPDAEKAREGIEAARDAEREAIRRLTAAARKLLADEHGAATDATLERVAQTLRAAAVTEEGRELLARGRLPEELSTTGFDVVAGLSPPKRTPARPKKRDRSAEVAAAREALKEARAREREAAKRVRRAEAELEEARAEADEAAEAVAEAEEALQQARGGD